MINIKVREVSEHYTCGDGCCDDYNDFAYVTMPTGEEFRVDVTCSYNEMYELILDYLGYRIAEDD